MTDVEELVADICKYVAEHSSNSTKEFTFATPYPRWELDSYSLLEHIAEVTGVSRKQIAEWSTL